MGHRASLKLAMKKERAKFEELFLWLEANLPPAFFEEVGESNIRLIPHILMEFDLQGFFSHFLLKDRAFVLCLDTPDADVKVLKLFQMYGVKSYRAFVSKNPPPFKGVKLPLRVVSVFFAEENLEKKPLRTVLSKEKKASLFVQVQERNPEVSKKTFIKLTSALSPRFLSSVAEDRLVVALDVFARAQKTDLCQYDVRFNEDWKESDLPSMQIVFAWKNIPKHNFFFRIAKTVLRHNLVMKRVNAVEIDPYSNESIALIAIGLHGKKGKAAWEEADIDDFIKELITVKFFEENARIEQTFVEPGLLSGNLGNLVHSIVHFVHQALVCEDSNLYSFSNVEEALCRHPELTIKLTEAFTAKFHPEKHDIDKFEKIKKEYLKLVDKIDTGHETNDGRRKNILRQAMHFVHFTLKSNFYRTNKTGFAFRLDPAYLNHLPFDRNEKYPELPFAIFFFKGMYFIGFHIRFKDLARGGLRTVVPEREEQLIVERNQVFSECYNLAYTQQKKNKDIPEGGAKGVILMEPYERLRPEEEIYRQELSRNGISPEEIDKKIQTFRKGRKLEYLYETQRSYIDSFLPLINCHADGTLKAKSIIDFYHLPEYIYLGPDENMHNKIIEWISNYSIYHGYKPGSCFITSKPGAGINHKEYGVTSLGVNAYMVEVLHHLGIDPKKESFSVKMTGGPDGDVAGNQILNLHKYFKKTAKLVALIDVSGTIFDPLGLDLDILAQFFHEEKPIAHYPPEQLSVGGFLLNLFEKRDISAYVQQTLCSKMTEKGLVQEWLSGNEMNHLLRHNVHQAKCDIFIPAGGRPKTLHGANVKEYLDETGKPSSKAIIEGANLYLTQKARRDLEKLGVLIIKDSSANKGGVICSSFEVLANLVLSEKEFITNKPLFMKETLAIIEARARDEGRLLLKTHVDTGGYLTDISDAISDKINTFTFQILDYLKPLPLSDDPKDPLIRCLLSYCPHFLRTRRKGKILSDIPDIHKKAIISCFIASRLVYARGLNWAPTIVDLLDVVAKSLISKDM